MIIRGPHQFPVHVCNNFHEPRCFLRVPKRATKVFFLFGLAFGFHSECVGRREGGGSLGMREGTGVRQPTPCCFSLPSG